MRSRHDLGVPLAGPAFARPYPAPEKGAVMAAKKYTVLLGYNVPPDGERHEAGEEVFLTDAAAEPLLALDAIEPIAVTHARQEAEAEAEANDDTPADTEDDTNAPSDDTTAKAGD